MQVYEKVRSYIDDNGYKQVTIAEKAGIPKGTFNAILNGKRTLYADDLKSICIALNVSPEVFISINQASHYNARDESALKNKRNLTL